MRLGMTFAWQRPAGPNCNPVLKPSGRVFKESKSRRINSLVSLGG